MENRELNKYLEELQKTVYEALENGATKEEVIKQLDYIKYEVKNLEDSK